MGLKSIPCLILDNCQGIWALAFLQCRLWKCSWNCILEETTEQQWRMGSKCAWSEFEVVCVYPPTDSVHGGRGAEKWCLPQLPCPSASGVPHRPSTLPAVPPCEQPGVRTPLHCWWQSRSTWKKVCSPSVASWLLAVFWGMIVETNTTIRSRHWKFISCGRCSWASWSFWWDTHVS